MDHKFYSLPPWHHPPVKRHCRAGDSREGSVVLSRRRHRIVMLYHHDMCHAVSRPLLFRTPHCHTSPPALDAGGLSRASYASMNFTLVISTRPHGSSPALSTQMVLEKVHTLCHLLEICDIVHVLTDTFLGFPYKCPGSPKVPFIIQNSTMHICPLQLSSIYPFFSTVITLRNLPAHSLESASSKHLCLVGPLNDKNLPCAASG